MDGFLMDVLLCYKQIIQKWCGWMKSFQQVTWFSLGVRVVFFMYNPGAHNMSCCRALWFRGLEFNQIMHLLLSISLLILAQRPWTFIMWICMLPTQVDLINLCVRLHFRLHALYYSTRGEVCLCICVRFKSLSTEIILMKVGSNGCMQMFQVALNRYKKTHQLKT